MRSSGGSGDAGLIADLNDLLLAFKAVEGQATEKHQRYARSAYPADVADVVRRGAADEREHYAWVERTLSERGVGEGTLPHNLASAVENVHKILANPVERLGREVMEKVGQAVGTTRARGGSEAPPPRDATEGMAARRTGVDPAAGDGGMMGDPFGGSTRG